MQYVVGIDPGVTGGWAVMREDGKLISHGNFPLIEVEKPNKRKNAKSATRIDRTYDIPRVVAKMQSIKNMYAPHITAIESVHSMPTDGSTQAFKFGMCFGILLGALIATGLDVIKVRPADWMRVMHGGGNKDLDAKKRSQQALLMMYPALTGTGRRTLAVSEGEMDAILLAEWARRTYKHNRMPLPTDSRGLPMVGA